MSWTSRVTHPWPSQKNKWHLTDMAKAEASDIEKERFDRCLGAKNLQKPDESINPMTTGYHVSNWGELSRVNQWWNISFNNFYNYKMGPVTSYK